ncbi:phage tail protein I [Turicimonas muris]|uniref:phage tail protein I n=1 Tax=Turicimonas muris TaxID=1796652 RepID=UPI00249546D8|nr:phage tail protein I [Turicimonas muris]
MKTLDNVTLKDLLPDSIKKDASVRDSAEAIDPQLKAIATATDLAAVFASIDKLTSLQLDHLAAGFDVTTWRDTWPIDLKRRVAKVLATQKNRMGTLSAIKEVLSSLGASVRITEWWQETPKGTPHTFKVIASLQSLPGVLDIQTQEDFFALLDDAKPARSHYTFTLAQNGAVDICLFAAGRAMSFARHISRQGPVEGQISLITAGRGLSFARHSSL